MAKRKSADDLYEERRFAILKYLRFPLENGAHEISVDVLDAEFVDSFIEATGAPYKVMFYGANRCACLGPLLARMAKEGSLVRSTVSISGMAGMGFPPWVYCYKLSEMMKPQPQKKD